MSRRRKVSLAVAILTVLAAIGASNVVVLREGAARMCAAEDAPAVDAIVVLGAGVHPDGTPSDMLRDRLETALDLYRAGRAPVVLVSGDHGSIEHDEPGTMRAWLEGRGVKAEAIVEDHAGFDTYSSMWRARNVFAIRRALVVTQRFHLPRALFVAERLGLEASGVSADRQRYRGIVWSELREVASRPKAWLDVAVGRTPRFAGERA